MRQSFWATQVHQLAVLISVKEQEARAAAEAVSKAAEARAKLPRLTDVSEGQAARVLAVMVPGQLYGLRDLITKSGVPITSRNIVCRLVQLGRIQVHRNEINRRRSLYSLPTKGVTP